MGSFMNNGRTRMKKVVGASATALMMAALLTGCDNKCEVASVDCDPCATVECTPAKTSAKVTRITTMTDESSIPCIAVMPFQCVDDDPSSGFIVADALADSLASIDGCVVYSPEVVTTRVQFKEGDVMDPVEVGKQLNAPYILTGRVTEYVESEDEDGQTAVGVTATLIDTSTGEEVWTAEQYEEYMKGTLIGWSEAVSNDVAKAINLKPRAVAATPSVASRITAQLAENIDDADLDFDMPDDLAMSDAPAAGGANVIQFNTDIDPDDFGLEQPGSGGRSSGPIGEEYGVVAASPTTAMYGTPTLPTDEVGRILDRFEDPITFNYYSSATTESTEDYSYDLTLSDDEMDDLVDMDVASHPAAPVTEYVPEMPISQAVETPAAGTNKYEQFHYTGANPFADGPGKIVEQVAEVSAPSLFTADVEAVAETTEPAEDFLATKSKAEPKQTDDLFMPAPPAIEPPALPENHTGISLFMPEPLQPVDMSDMSAMVAPELPSRIGATEVAMPDPLKSEKSASANEDAFMMSISADKFLEESSFDFFGGLSAELQDMDDIEE